MTYLSPPEYAAKHGVSARRIIALLAQGRIPGAYQHMGRWAIPMMRRWWSSRKAD